METVRQEARRKGISISEVRRNKQQEAAQARDAEIIEQFKKVALRATSYEHGCKKAVWLLEVKSTLNPGMRSHYEKLCKEAMDSLKPVEV